MTNSNNVNQAVAVRDSVDNAPLADTNAPKIQSAFELHYARRTWVCHQCLELFEDTSGDLRIKAL